MSSSIWTRCGSDSNLQPLLLKPWRAVDAEAVVSARKLVDSSQEQEVLEGLIDGSEHSSRPIATGRELHPLLLSPFRQPPLRYGSRFGRRHEQSLWYGSENERTAFAEVAYYRLLFLSGTAADLAPVLVELSSFRVPIHTEGGVDLTLAPFDAWNDALTSRSDYSATQALGTEMRRDGVEAFRYRAVRDVEGGTNCGLFTPRAFASRRPGQFRSWLCVAAPTGVEITLKDHLRRRSYHFPREDFEVAGDLPAPAI